MEQVENKEEVKVTFDQKLLNNIKQLEQSIAKLSNDLQQSIGALEMARFNYQEYMKELQPPEVVKTEE